MPSHITRFASLLAMALASCALAGCGTINKEVAAGMGDYVPQWLGGLPADAPPRPGTAKYDEWMKERQGRRLESAPATNAATSSSSISSTPVESGALTRPKPGSD